MLKSLPYATLLLSTLTLFSPTSSAETVDNENKVMVPAFKANYTILRSGKAVGKASRELNYLANNVAQYSYHTDIVCWRNFITVKLNSRGFITSI